MKDATFSHNLSALEYAKTASRKIENICAPLFDNLGLTIFAYIKVMPDYKMLHLNSSQNWTQNFFKNTFYNEDDCFHRIRNLVAREGDHTFVLSGSPNGKGKHCAALYDFDIWNTYSIYKKRENYVEGWAFGTSKKKESILDLYTNHSYILHAFTLYFSEKAFDFTTNAQDSHYIHTSRSLNAIDEIPEDENIQHFLQAIYPKRFPIVVNQQKVVFSRREMECLSLLSNGGTAKEIAEALGLSSRTVEGYIENMKSKAGVQKKCELVQIFLDHFETFEIRKISKMLRKDSG